MKRRDVLSVFALSLSSGCLGSLPSATGPRKPPEAPEGKPRAPSADPSIETWDYGETDEGTLTVFGTIKNPADVETTVTVAVTVTVDEDKHTKSADYTVPAGGTTDFDLTFEVSFDQFQQHGSIDLELA